MTPEERRTPRSSGPGWIATAGGALFLVAVGFSVGLVAGTAYQEPQLVADHLAGRTTEVVLESEETLAATPDVAAPAPAGAEPPASALGEGALDPETQEPAAPLAALAVPEAEAEVQAELEAAPAPAPKPAAKPAPMPAAGGSFSIQVGAFGSEPAASQLAAELAKRGYPSYVAEEGEGARFKVRVGPIGSRDEAETISAQLKREHRLPTWILAGKR